MNTLVLDGKLYAEMIRNGAANLNRNREEVNDLNVFPVPDGDTGDNMYLTIDSGSNAAASCEEDDLSAVSNKIANGMLMGARGNSGVILSRIFAGVAKSLANYRSADVRVFGKAYEDAIKEAYSAVSKPVDGTILSVYRDAVRCANSQIGEDTSFENYFGSFVQELKESLARTPSLLQVLKDAGVVDSGGAGFVYIAESPLFEITTKDRTYFAYDEKERVKILSMIEGQKFTLQRSKGLGENEAEMMALTTMNPETRRIIRITPEDAEATADMFEMLLGDNLAARKDYIAENGGDYLDLADIS